MAVNGVSVEGEHHERAVELLKASKEVVKIVVRYNPHVLEELENRFDRGRRGPRNADIPNS